MTNLIRILVCLTFSLVASAQMPSPVYPPAAAKNSAGTNLDATPAEVVVAVGEAKEELRKYNIVFAPIDSTKTTLEQRLAFKKMQEIILEDLSWYQHLYEVGSGTVVNVNLASSSASISMEGQALAIAHGGAELRASAHKVAAELHRLFTGRESIFEDSILFVQESVKGVKELWRMDFDGANRRQLTRHGGVVLSPAAAPSGTFAVYSLIESSKKNRGKRNVNLLRYDFATKKITPVSAYPGINSGVVFAQDDDHILLTLTLRGNADIYHMNLKTKRIRALTRHWGDDVDPTLSGDGKLLSFLSTRPGRAMIYTMNPEKLEGDVKRVSFVGRFNATPRFSPDGKEIVFVSWLENRFDLYRISVSGKEVVRLTKDFGHNEEPWFSRDGEFIAFTSQRVSGGPLAGRKATQDIYVMNRDGRIVKKLNSSKALQFSPRWCKCSK